MQPPGSPRDVLVVGWSPAIDDAAAGRFIADQAAALLASGRVRPYLATWEQASLGGDGPLRRSQAEAAERILARGRAAHPTAAVMPGAFGPAGVPVARLTALAGQVPGMGGDHQGAHRWTALARLLDAPDAPRPALVHGHVGYPEGLAASLAAERLGVPFILTEHASYLARIFADPAQREAYATATRRARRVVAVSDMLAAELEAAFPHLQGRVAVIPNTVAVEAFRPAPLEERDPDALLWVGYRRRAKGIDTLLAAFRLIHAARPSTTLRLIGQSATADEEQEWHRLAGELGVADAVRFDGPADRTGVATAMERASLFVHASPRETFGIVAAEALAAGLPVIATDSGGVTGILGDDPERLGAVVPAGDAEGLATAVLAALERRTTFDPAALRAHVESRFGAPAVAARIADLYDEVLEEAGPAAGGAAGHGAAGAAAGPGAAAVPTVPAWDRDRPLILVGFGRTQLDQVLGGLPAELRASLAVVTVGDAVPGVRRTVLAPDGSRAGIARLVGRGVRVRPGLLGRGIALAARVRRVLLRPRGDARTRVVAVLRSTVAEAIDGESSRPLVIALGGLDYLALDGLPDDTFVPAAGGIRWLGDRWWAARARPVHGPSGAAGEPGQTDADRPSGEPASSA